MFSPSQEDVRRFFCEAFAKSRDGKPMEAIETLAARWMDEHPEYHADFSDLDAALASMQTVTLATVAPGIAEALVATAIALFAAIPAVVAYNRFAHDIDRIANRLETFIEEFSNILQRNLGAQSASGH